MTKRDEKIKCFLCDIEKVYRKYDLSISHEDSHGSFIIEKFDQYNLDWLQECYANVEWDDLTNNWRKSY
jgi:hypothetical protein